MMYEKRFADLIRSARPLYPKDLKPGEQDSWIEPLRQARTLVADNVSHFILGEDIAPKWDTMSVDQFPCVLVPFPSLLIEWKEPYAIEQKIAKWGGAFVYPIPEGKLSRVVQGFLDYPEAWERWGISREETERRLNEATGGIMVNTLIGAPEGWWVWYAQTLVAHRPDGTVTGFMRSRIQQPLNESGNAMAQLLGQTVLDTSIVVALYSLSLLHCKNVEYADGPAPPPRLSRRYQERHGAPLIRYKVLSIDPMKKVIRKAAQESGEHVSRALHLVRGHFKTYSPEKPLLGRATGTYWWPHHVRGDMETGVVVKDYKLKGAGAK